MAEAIMLLFTDQTFHCFELSMFLSLKFSFLVLFLTRFSYAFVDC